MTESTFYQLTVLMLILTSISNFALGSDAVANEQAKKDGWIQFCSLISTFCPILANPTAIPLATTLKRKANGTMNAITATFTVESFMGISELEQQFSLHGTFRFEWELPNCAKWPEAKDGELPNFCAFPRDGIWHPSFYHGNAQGSGSPFDTGVDQVTVTNGGEAIWYVRGQFDSRCTLNFKNFPFDEQTCSLIMRWQRMGDAQNVQVWPNIEIKQGAFPASSVWTLVENKTKSYYFDGARQIEFTFKLQRRPETYAGTMFLPMVLLMFIQTSVYWMPAEMADRTGMSMTIFLSSAVLLTVISQSIPATAEMLGIIVLFGAQTTLGVAITIYTTISLRFADHYGEKYMEEKPIKMFGLKIQCTRITFIDSIAAVITVVIYAILSVVILGLMITNKSYSPFYTEPPAEIILQNEMVHSALGHAAADGQIDEVRRLLQLPGIDINWWDERNFSDCGRPPAVFPTALRRAVSCNHTQVVKLLLEKGARINETDTDRQSDTFLITAVLHNNAEMARLLLDYNASVVQLKRGSEIFNALAAAAYTGNVDIAEELLDRGASRYDTNSTKSTIAMIAAERGNVDILKIHGILDGIGSMRDADGKSAMFYVGRSGNDQLLNVVGVHASEEDKAQALQVAAMYGHPLMVARLFPCNKYNKNLNEFNETPLLTAIRGAIQGGFPGNHTEVVRRILESKSCVVDVNIVGRANQTALMLATKLPSLDIFSMLLDNKANISQVDNNGWTPFIYAARYGSYEMLELLIKKGDNFSVNLVIENKKNSSMASLNAFHYSAANCDSRILKYLYTESSDKNVYIQDADGNTNLMLAAENSCLENVRFLLDLDASWVSNVEDNRMSRVLSNFEIVRVIMDKKPELVNENIGPGNQNPLHFAAYHGSTLLQYLLDHGANVNATFGSGNTPLMLAVMGKQPVEATRALLAHGAGVNTISERGWSALMFAAMRGNPAVVQLLVDNGTDVNLANTRGGLAPLLIAASYGNVQVVQFLLDHGAKINGRIGLTSSSCLYAVASCANEIKTLEVSGELGPVTADDKLEPQVVDEVGAEDARMLLNKYLEQQQML